MTTPDDYRRAEGADAEVWRQRHDGDDPAVTSCRFVAPDVPTYAEHEQRIEPEPTWVLKAAAVMMAVIILGVLVGLWNDG